MSEHAILLRSEQQKRLAVQAAALADLLPEMKMEATRRGFHIVAAVIYALQVAYTAKGQDAFFKLIDSFGVDMHDATPGIMAKVEARETLNAIEYQFRDDTR